MLWPTATWARSWSPSSALLAGGWGPQQLATEMVDDLRQVFLAALAPELSAASGPSLERFATLAETMGLPRVVRSLELLGHALVDMREAPDAQVVLEIAVVRAVRPDLDSGVEALSERVSVLERSLSGAAAFPRPGAPPERAASLAGSQGAGPAAAPAAAPERPAGEVGRRPSIGAVRRSQQAAAASSASGTAPADVAPDIPAPEAAPAPAARTEAAPSGTIDRDSLTEAWGDGILRTLPARAKALYSAGRFVSVDAQGAHFALPNAAHRERCADLAPTVEAALAAHFGSPVTLVLDVDEATPPGTLGGGAAAARGGGPGDVADVEEVDPADFAADDVHDAATDQASAAEARLLQAFPGASEVTG